ncbi:methyl-accepting chemotaxis protein [Fundidesulfovibrio butyratiphilus]
MFKKSISSVLIVSVTAAILAIFIPLILYVSHSSEDMAGSMQRQAITQAAESTERSLAEFIFNAENIALNLAGQAAVVEVFTLSPVRAADRLKNYMESYKHSYWAMLVFDRNGKVVVGFDDSGRNLAGKDFAGRRFVKSIDDGKSTYISNLAHAADGDKENLTLTAASPVKDKSGKVLGGVAVFPKLNAFTVATLNPWRFGKRGYGFILDGEGRVMAHAADKGMLLKDVASHKFIQIALAKKNGVVDYQWKDGEKFMAFATEPKTGWVVCMSAYVDEMTALALRQRTILITSGVVGLLILVGAVAFISIRLVSRPVHRIEAFTDAVAKGDLRAQLNETFQLELGHLADNIRTMVSELRNKLAFSEGVLAGVTLPCIVYSQDNKLIFVNQYMLSAAGYTGKPEDFLGQTSGDFYFKDPGRETTVTDAIRSGQMSSGEVDYVTPGGEKRIFHVTSTPFKDMDGKPLGVLAIWFDLTVIRQQQQAMEEQNTTIARAADSANDISERLSVAAHELKDNMTDAGDATSTQRTRIADVATAMEEMNATVLEVAKNSAQVADLADKAKAQAQEGAQSVAEVTDAIEGLSTLAANLSRDMGELGHHAQGIGQIMTVIADIADQTNLLALNAAIEAARAGEAGRGFAVVADEVRKLAEKTMHATSEVSQAIQAIQDSARKNVATTEDTVRQIDQGALKAGHSRQALSAIVELIEQTSDQVRTIATAAEEQSAASEEINRSVDEINTIAARTADVMDHSSGSVADLAKVARDLKDTIGAMCATGLACKDQTKALMP